MALKRVEITSPDEHTWYRVYSDTIGKAVLQVETGAIYGEVAMRDDDSHTYEECDDPEYHDVEIPAEDALNIITVGAEVE